MVAKDKAGEIIDDAKENIEDMFYSATTAATAFVFSATGIIDEALDGIRNLAVIKTASEIKEDVKNKLTSGINDLLGGAFDVKAVSTANGIEINIGKDFCLEVGCPMNADKMKDIKNWTIDAVFDDQKHDTEKIKNVIDTQTLGNIREVSETLYNDLLEMIIKDGESAESIIDIVDCINNDTEEFKKAYKCFKDVKKAYECINDESGILAKYMGEDTTTIKYRNYYGTKLRFPKQTPQNILRSIEKKKESENDGERLEAEVAEFISNKKIKIEGFRAKVDIIDDNDKRLNTAGDIDVETDKYLIEVKINIKQLHYDKQISKYTDKYHENFLNFKNKKVIVYVEEKFDKADLQGRLKGHYDNSVSDGAIIVNSKEELGKVLEK